MRRGVLLTAFGTIGTVAQAADGCKVLLCLASSNWRAIEECVPPIREVMRDLALGRPFPVCDMSGQDNSARHNFAVAPMFCPPQYTYQLGTDSPTYACTYDGAISVTISGEAFTRTWWSSGGDTVTEFSAAAKQLLGTWDPRFDNDYAAWLAAHPAPSNPDNN